MGYRFVDSSEVKHIMAESAGLLNVGKVQCAHCGMELRFEYDQGEGGNIEDHIQSSHEDVFFLEVLQGNLVRDGREWWDIY